MEDAEKNPVNGFRALTGSKKNRSPIFKNGKSGFTAACALKGASKVLRRSLMPAGDVLRPHPGGMPGAVSSPRNPLLTHVGL